MMLDGESLPLVEVSVSEEARPKTEAWMAAARFAADELFKYSHVRRHADPGTLVYLKFDTIDFEEDLRTVAIAAFNERWKQLVPGWEPPIKDPEVLAQ